MRMKIVIAWLACCENSSLGEYLTLNVLRPCRQFQQLGYNLGFIHRPIATKLLPWAILTVPPIRLAAANAAPPLPHSPFGPGP